MSNREFNEKRTALANDFAAAGAAAVAPSDAKGKADVCKVCNGARVVDDGEIDCYPNGEPFMCGPVKRVKDCDCCGKGEADAANAGGVDWGLEIAALHLDKQREEHDREHARQEWDTGAWVFDRPEQEEYSNLLDELAEEIRALKGKTAATSAADAKDAERYRYLRGSATDIGNVIDKEFAPGKWEYRAGEELDAAIDAAIAATQGCLKDEGRHHD